MRGCPICKGNFLAEAEDVGDATRYVCQRCGTFTLSGTATVELDEDYAWK